MVDDQMGYNAMVEDAMRAVVRKALNAAAAEGLPGEHHFYITFRTDQPGVQLPDHLKQRYPREMTIVLQHQFWNLTVTDEALEVDLSFNQKLERLRVPMDSLITFADPSVNFGLQFHPMGADDDDLEDGLEQAFEQDAVADESQDAAAIEAVEDGDAEDGDEDNVVTLDTFRKK